jgi:hypothetical protein
VNLISYDLIMQQFIVNFKENAKANARGKLGKKCKWKNISNVWGKAEAGFFNNNKQSGAEI